jgi:3-deoxy-D-manno-octulosonate 8-phosphate phosphatase (KDO 8-P phosphatase)
MDYNKKGTGLKRKKVEKDFRGELVIRTDEFRKKIKDIKLLVFDWDGIFNDGSKSQMSSSFNEIDSMGINMLRFGYFLRNRQNPITAIVTGERNDTAIHWAEREHFHYVFFKVKNKADVQKHLLHGNNMNHEDILFVFDDIHDLSLAMNAGLRILVKNPGAKLFADYCKKMKYCDYITKNSGGNLALREISELILNQLDLFERTIENRMNFHGVYSDYFQIRNLVKTTVQELNG